MPAALFAIQFIVRCPDARNARMRLVCNALSVHCTDKVTKSKAIAVGDVFGERHSDPMRSLPIGATREACSHEARSRGS
jgi:hypothetical protein